MAEKKSAVAEQKTAEIVQFDPTMFEEDAGVGLENMGQDDLALPFLKILGGMSKELDDLEDARKGDIYNTVTGAVYKGKDGIKVIPVAYQRRFIQWAPRGEGTGAPTAIYSPGEAMPKTERSTEDLLKTLLEENSKGSWHGWEMSRVGPVEDAATYQRAKDFAKSITEGDVVVKHQDESAGNETPDDIPF